MDMDFEGGRFGLDGEAASSAQAEEHRWGFTALLGGPWSRGSPRAEARRDQKRAKREAKQVDRRAQELFDLGLEEFLFAAKSDPRLFKARVTPNDGVGRTPLLVACAKFRRHSMADWIGAIGSQADPIPEDEKPDIVRRVVFDDHERTARALCALDARMMLTTRFSEKPKRPQGDAVQWAVERTGLGVLAVLVECAMREASADGGQGSLADAAWATLSNGLRRARQRYEADPNLAAHKAVGMFDGFVALQEAKERGSPATGRPSPAEEPLASSVAKAEAVAESLARHALAGHGADELCGLMGVAAAMEAMARRIGELEAQVQTMAARMEMAANKKTRFSWGNSGGCRGARPVPTPPLSSR